MKRFIYGDFEQNLEKTAWSRTESYCASRRKHILMHDLFNTIISYSRVRLSTLVRILQLSAQIANIIGPTLHIDWVIGVWLRSHVHDWANVGVINSAFTCNICRRWPNFGKRPATATDHEGDFLPQKQEWPNIR